VSLPVGDWQFWVVTAAAALAAMYLLREVLPAKVSPFRKRRKGKPASLTISGKTPGRK